MIVTSLDMTGLDLDFDDGLWTDYSYVYPFWGGGDVPKDGSDPDSPDHVSRMADVGSSKATAPEEDFMPPVFNLTDGGSSSTEGGEIWVDFSEGFQRSLDLTDDGTAFVTVTPIGSDAHLHIVRKDSNGFLVRTDRGDANFDWIAMCPTKPVRERHTTKYRTEGVIKGDDSPVITGKPKR